MQLLARRNAAILSGRPAAEVERREILLEGLIDMGSCVLHNRLEPAEPHRDQLPNTGLSIRPFVDLAELSGRVWSVEIVEELAGQAEANLRQLGCSDVAIRIGDGSRGWREHAPYDRALLIAAAERLPPAILDQIKPGGRIVLPLGPDEAQRLTVVDKGADGQTSVRELIPVRFSRLETVV